MPTYDTHGPVDSGDLKKYLSYLIAARKAVKFTKEKLPVGADNKIGQEALRTYGLMSAGALLLPFGGPAIGLMEGLRQHSVKHQAVAETKMRHDAFGTPKSGTDWSTYIDTCARVAMQTGAGNCGEHAAVAFVYLRDFHKQARPMDFMSFTGPGRDHNFIIIGRPDGMGPERFSEWSKTAVVCDPWRGSADFAGMLNTWYGWTQMESKWRLT